jgi:hypothetical protein
MTLPTTNIGYAIQSDSLVKFASKDFVKMLNNDRNLFKRLLLTSSNDIFKFMNMINWSTEMFTFRGQSDCNWDISSGLERRFPKFLFGNERKNKLNSYEKDIIKKFQTVSHHHLRNFFLIMMII